MPEKVVIDTSVMISALIGKCGASREVIRRCLTGEYVPQISNSLFQEYEDASSRKVVRQACPLSGGGVQDLLNAFYSVCAWVTIYYLWRPNMKDESDNFLIELALAANSRIIVTNNVRDLQAAQLGFDDLRILKPQQLMIGD